MARIKRSFNRNEIFHAWVNQSGLSYYKSSNSWNSITGYNNVLISGDKIYNFKENKSDEQISDSIKYNYSASVIAIIDRDNKTAIVKSDYIYELKKALPNGYVLYITDNKLDNYKVLDNKEYCIKEHCKYLLRLFYYRISSEFLVLTGKQLVFHDNIKSIYDIYISRGSIHTQFGELLKFIRDNKVKQYSWYSEILIKDIFIDYYRGFNKYDIKVAAKSLKDVCNKKIFTKTEILLLEQRAFWTRYCFNNSVSFKEVQANWNKPFESKHIKESNFKYDKTFVTWNEYIIARSSLIKNIEVNRDKEYYDKNSENLEAAKKEFENNSRYYLEDWRNYKKYFKQTPYEKYVKNRRSGQWVKTIANYFGCNFDVAFVTTQLRLNSTKTTIETSRNCAVPLKDGIRLYKLIETILLESHGNIKPNSKTLIKDFKDKNIKCGIYKLLELYCDIKPDTDRLEFCVVIGCHHLWLDDIKNFINYYGLNKEFEL